MYALAVGKDLVPLSVGRNYILLVLFFEIASLFAGYLSIRFILNLVDGVVDEYRENLAPPPPARRPSPVVHRPDVRHDGGRLRT